MKFIGKIYTDMPDKFGVPRQAGNVPELDEFQMVEELNKTTGADVPKPLASLKDKQVRFNDVCNKEDMSQMVFKLLKL